MTRFFKEVPSGQLGELFAHAAKFAEAEDAPSVRLDHFMAAALFHAFPPDAWKTVVQIALAWQREGSESPVKCPMCDQEWPEPAES